MALPYHFKAGRKGEGDTSVLHIDLQIMRLLADPRRAGTTTQSNSEQSTIRKSASNEADA